MIGKKWKNRKVLVTGSEGFIGSHLVERLIELGAKVRAFVLYNSFNNWGWLDTFEKSKLDRIEIITGDISEAYNVRKAMEGIDTVFHLAALIAIPYSYNSPEAYVSTNVAGTLNLLQAARDYKIKKFVHTSTSEVYGTARYVPIDENHPLQGQSPYSATKISADMLAYSFHCSFGLPVVILRPFNTYGPRQSARAVIPTIISQISCGMKTVKLGILSPVRDFLYIEDTVDGFIKASESPGVIGDVVNVGYGKGISIGDLAEKIKKIMGSKAKIKHETLRHRPEKSEVMKLVCSNKKAGQLMGWSPRYELDEGLKKTIEFVEGNMKYYKPDIYNL